MRIAILDDEQAFLEAASQRILTLLQQNFPQEASDLSVDLFATAGALLRSAESVVYDLAILDICMDGINGMEAAEQIRARDSEAGILFVTRSEAYLLDGYRVFADGYFLKPLDQQDDAVLIAALERVIQRVGSRAKTLVVEEKRQIHALPFSKIQYMDIENGRVHIVMKNREIHLAKTKSYREVAEVLLSDARFLECYNKIMVNMDWIEEMEEEHFRLQDGKRVPISRRCRQDTRARYMKYLLGGTRGDCA